MGNMSYCRFENTSNALQDCVDNWNEEDVDDLNEHEQKGKRRIIALAREIVEIEGDE